MSDRAMEILRLALDYARSSTLEEDPVPAWVEEGEQLLRDAGIVPRSDDAPAENGLSDIGDALDYVFSMARAYNATSKRSEHDPIRIKREEALRMVEDHIVNEHGDN